MPSEVTEEPHSICLGCIHLAVSSPVSSDLVKEPRPAKHGSLPRVHTSKDRAYTSKVGVTYIRFEPSVLSPRG